MSQAEVIELVALRKAVLEISRAVDSHLAADGTSSDEFIDRIIEILADPEISHHVARLEVAAAADLTDAPKKE